MRMSETTSQPADDNDDDDVIRLRDATRTVEFQGELLSRVSTEVPSLPRWTTMELYRMTDGTNRYVLSIVGYSVVYHVSDGFCDSGVSIPITELPSDAEPCVKCKPPFYGEDRTATGTVNMEENYYQVAVCDSAAAVRTRLEMRKHGEPPALSRPALRLLKIAAHTDSAFDAGSVVERL